MAHNRIATLARLHTAIVNDADPTPGLAELAARLTADHALRPTLYRLADGRELAGAVLWARIADQVTAAPRLESLTIAAVLAAHGDDPGMAAGLIVAAETAAATDRITLPPLLALLALDHRIRDHLGHPAA
ncbi:hypothetical protein [Mycolicibacterium llatzerense]|uniref:hypothetical protein n=1 Tax=Mycolicibacterium llatzerense TaxID=280871 RepID=UPI0008DE2829|nr:hypothetical protein [Mycolicibacterium llatzerense]